MKSTLIATVIVALFGITTAAQAQIVNPDNDSGAYFRNVQATATPTVAARLPQVGEISADGLQVYSGGDRGWVNRTHSYMLEEGHVVHAQNCLPYNAPKVAAGGGVTLQTGTFADHGA